MKVFRCALIAAFLASVLSLGACGSDPHPPIGMSDPNLFAVDEDNPKFFFYASYVSDDLKPYFADIFRLEVDKDYKGDIAPDQFAEDDLGPGKHLIEVDQIAASGTVINHATATVVINPQTLNFIAMDVLPDDKANLGIVNVVRGMTDVRERARRCGC